MTESGTFDKGLGVYESGEREPSHAAPVLLLGAGSGTGKMLAERMSANGYQVFVGTRSYEKYQSVKDFAERRGGVAPKPFIADIKDSRQVEEAIDSMGLSEGQTIDYFPFAADGMGPIGLRIGIQLKKLEKKFREEGPSLEAAREATEKMKAFVLQDSSQALATETNAIAPVLIAQELTRRGHINKDSRIAILDSMISKYTEADDPENYPGPWLYYPIGRSKAEGARDLRRIAHDTGAEFLDFVAPDIEGTGVGNFFLEFEGLFGQVSRLENSEFKFPVVSMGHVANVIIAEMARRDAPRNRDIYIPSSGGVQYSRPEEFVIPTTPYL